MATGPAPSDPAVRGLIKLAAVCLLAGCAAQGGTNVGLTDDGRLPPCPSSPNCVSSDADDEAHRIAPLAVTGDPAAAWRRLVDHVQADPAYTIVAQTERYLHAEARTRLLRFVDDVEFHLRPADGEIAMRSASRLGYSDLGANRRRLERLRAALAGAL